MTSLMDVAMAAPIVGHADHTFHAVVMQAAVHGLAQDEPLLDAACGEQVKGLVMDDETGRRNIVQWPPAVDSLPDGWERCDACHNVTGMMTPRCTFEDAP